MVTEQETLIYIEDQDKKDASVAANAFAHKDTKNRAYINTLGADLALKYLASENIDVSNVYNIHSIKKILEEMDISDIMLPNIHIDVRVVFDENVIFIPKSHFEYNIEPDIYLVFNLAKDFSHVKFLGFFEPRLINKNNANDKYYFIEKEKLSSVVDLKKYIESHKGNTTESLSQEDIENSERIIISMADNDISENDKKFLIKQLTKSAELRDKFIEYENFETLSYKAMTDPLVTKKPIEDNNTSQQVADISILDELDNITDIPAEEIQNNTDTTEASENNEITNSVDLTTEAQIEDLNLEPIENIDNITLENNNTDEQTNTTTDNQKTQNTLDNISSSIAEGLAAGAAAAATGELLNTAASANAAIDMTDTALNIVDSGIEIAKDLMTSENTQETEPISFDNIDTSNIEDITSTPNENIEEETISLGNVELPEKDEETDFLEQIDNKISFDNIDTTNIIENDDNINIEDNHISLNDIDTSNLIETNDQENYTPETLSFDDIDTTNIKNAPEIDKDSIDNTISFDDIDIPNIKETSEQTNLNTIEPIEETESTFDIENSTQNSEQNLNIQEDQPNDFMDDTISLDDTSDETIDIQNTQQDNNDISNEELNTTDENNFDNINDVNSEPLENTIEPEIVEDPTLDETSNDSFGKNLMESLSSDNIDDIAIEDLGIDENIPHDNENISSNDLLSQIDDVLNSTPNQEIPNNINSSDNINQKGNETSFDDIPTISNFTTEDNTQISDDNLSDIIAKQNYDDTNIDELLNFDDSTNPHETDNTKDEGNIDVLFNDTDTTSDNELDNIDEIDNMDFPQQQIPGAALYNKKSSSNKKQLLITAALVTVIAAASAVMVLKPKNDSAADLEPVKTETSENDTTNDNLDNQETDGNTDNILATNAPDINKNQTQSVQKQKTISELKNTATKQKQTPSSYINVDKLVWDVPSNLSYNNKFQNYLRTAGKSIKLSLSADLLLATEYAYTNQVKVNIKLNKDGSVQESKVLSSSGSNQIDNIVLQSVKDTLNVVKPPVDAIKTPDLNLGLIIYF